MKVLVTGSRGFIGKNLINLLMKNTSIEEIMEYDRNCTFDELEKYCQKADAVFHLAAVLRPKSLGGFDDNIDLTSRLLEYLQKAHNKCAVMFASSIQATLDNPYAECKRIEESKLIDYGQNNETNVYIFRFPNLFGTMSRPNYTSVISTYCYNTVMGLPISVNNPAAQIKFAFVEDVLEYVTNVVFENSSALANAINEIEKYYPVGLGELSYYMETLKRDIAPQIHRNDDFYEKLKYTYNWYELNHEKFDITN